MVPAISDRGLEIPVVFNQSENTVIYALSPQKRYNNEVQEALHGKSKKSKFNEVTEIQTNVSTFLIPDRCTPENIKLKEALAGSSRKEVFRTSLIQGYIDEDWENFAQKYAYVEFALYLAFVTLFML